MSSSCEAGRQEQVWIPPARPMAALVLSSPRRAWQVESVLAQDRKFLWAQGLVDRSTLLVPERLQLVL